MKAREIKDIWDLKHYKGQIIPSDNIRLIIQMRLHEIIEVATMEKSCFYHADPEKDKEIKDRTRNWRESWIIEPLKAILEAL